LFEQLSADLQGDLARLRALLEADVPAFNRAVKEQDIPAVIVK